MGGELPEDVRDDLVGPVIEESELLGFWLAWWRAGGFSGLEGAGWNRATIFRRLRRFRTTFGVHPDEYPAQLDPVGSAEGLGRTPATPARAGPGPVTVPGPLLLTPEEAASVLRIGRTRLYELLTAGDIRSVKLGGSRRITVAALEGYVEALAGSINASNHGGHNDP